MSALITSNIRFDNPADKENQWLYRKDLLAKLLTSHHPYLVATQEGREPQLRELEKLLQMPLIDSHRKWIDKRMYPCLFYNDNFFKLKESGDLWLSETPEIPGSSSFKSAFPRLMTWARLCTKNQDYLVCNMHLDHIQPSTRESQMKVFCTQVLKILKQSDRLIVLGDFNDSPQSATRQQIIKCLPFLHDPWITQNKKEETSHHSFLGSKKTQGHRIDWILLDKRIEISDISFDKNHQANRYPSDHYPVILKAEL